MKLRFTLRAARQIEEALAYVSQQSPQRAAKLKCRRLSIIVVLRFRHAARKPA